MKKNLLVAFVAALSPFAATAQLSGGNGSSEKAQKSVVPPNVINLDGILVNPLENHHGYFITMPDFAYSVDDNRLQRGPGYADNGAGSFGAFMAVQAVDRRDESYVELNNTYGSLSTWRTVLKGGTGLINNKFSLDGRMSYINSNGFMNRSNCDIRSYFLSGAHYGKKSMLRLNAFLGQEFTNQNWAVVPELEAQANRLSNLYNYDGQTDRYNQGHYQALYAYEFSDRLSLSAVAHYSHSRGFNEENPGAEQEFVNYINSGLKGSLMRRRALNADFYGANYALNYKLQPNVKLVWGGIYNNYHGDHFGDVLWAQGIKLDAPARYTNDKASKLMYHTFAQAYYDMGKFNFFADLSYRHIAYDFSGNFGSLGDISQSPTFNFINTKVVATYKLNPSDKLSLTYALMNGDPRREQILGYTPNECPKRQRWNNVSLGFNTQREKVKLDMGVFGMFYQDQLVPVGGTNAVADWLDVNVGKSHRIGFELEGTICILPQLKWTVNGVLTQNRIETFVDKAGVVYNNTPIASSPNIVAASQLAFSPCKKTEVALLNKYMGKQYRDNTGNENNVADAFFVHDLRLRYTTSFKRVKNIGATLLVNNIFGATYDINKVNAGNYNYMDRGFLVNKDYYFPQGQQNFLVGVSVGL